MPNPFSAPRSDIGWALSRDGFNSVVSELGVGPEEIWTVLAVETRGFGFLSNKLPLILFERHVFSRLTNGAHDAQAPGISNSTPGGYRGLEKEYPRLVEAAALDETAALRSCSWGLGQVMGFHAENLGYANVHMMVANMRRSEDDQIEAFKRFILVEGLDQALRDHDWAAFARRYNGPNYAINNYDTNLAAQFNRYMSGVVPDLDVRAAQIYLSYLDYNPYGIDGIMGNRTRSAIAAFLTDIGQPTVPDQVEFVSADLIAALEEAVMTIPDAWPLGTPGIA